MAEYETLVAIYANTEHAEAAVKALRAAGFSEHDISTFDANRIGSELRQKHGFWASMFGPDVHQHEAVVYSEVIDDGGVAVSVRVPANEVLHASGILDLHNPVDVHGQAVASGAIDMSHAAAVTNKLVGVPVASDQQVAVTEKLANEHPEVLRLAEEQFEIGKERVETGRTRVRRFLTERDIEEAVSLHDEHVEVLRRVITDPAELAEIDWADGEIDVIETTEHAVAKKTARVVEEISLKKIGAEHVETIHEKLRRQQAEIERLDTEGKPLKT